MSREQRKLDHIKYALKLGDGPLTNGLENVHLYITACRSLTRRI